MFTLVLDIMLVSILLSPLVWYMSIRIGFRQLFLIFLLGVLTATGISLVSLYREVSEKGIALATFGAFSQPPFGVCLELDALSVFMAIVQVSMLFMAIISSWGQAKEVKNELLYYILLLLITVGMIGVAFAGDLFTLYIFWELMCISSYVLVSYGSNEEEASEASVKYLLMSSVGGITLLFAISLLYSLIGTTNLAFIGASLASGQSNSLLLLAKGLFIFGYCLQTGIAPMHTWLPNAHSAAPSAVSVILSGAMVETGCYALVRTLLVSSFPMSSTIQGLLLFLALFSAFIGNLSALLQDDLKRLLAFSTIANMGYVLFGIAMGTVGGLTGALFHILNHAMSKGLLFLCAGAFELRAGSRSLNALSGISHTMTVTYVSFFIGAFSLAGFPLFGGFWSELLIIKSAFNVGALPLILILALNMILSMAYSLRMVCILTLKPQTEASKNAKEAPSLLLLPIVVLAFLCVFIGLFPNSFYALSESAATSAMDIETYFKAVLGT